MAGQLRQRGVHVADAAARVGDEHAQRRRRQHALEERLTILQSFEGRAALLLHPIEGAGQPADLVHPGIERHPAASPLAHFVDLRLEPMQGAQGVAHEPPHQRQQQHGEGGAEPPEPAKQRLQRRIHLLRGQEDPGHPVGRPDLGEGLVGLAATDQRCHGLALPAIQRLVERGVLVDRGHRLQHPRRVGMVEDGPRGRGHGGEAAGPETQPVQPPEQAAGVNVDEAADETVELAVTPPRHHEQHQRHVAGPADEGFAHVGAAHGLHEAEILGLGRLQAYPALRDRPVGQ